MDPIVVDPPVADLSFIMGMVGCRFEEVVIFYDVASPSVSFSGNSVDQTWSNTTSSPFKGFCQSWMTLLRFCSRIG